MKIDLKWPLPVGVLGPIQAELISILFASDLLVHQRLANAGAFDAETGHPINGVDGEAKAISLIADGQLQRRVDVALLLITAHVDVVLSWPAVGEAVYQPRVAVKVEDHWLVRGKDGLELSVGHTVGVFGMRHQ